MAEVLKEMKDPPSPGSHCERAAEEKQQSLSSVIEIQNVIKGGEEKDILYLPPSPPPRFLLPCHSSFFFLPSSTFWLLRAKEGREREVRNGGRRRRRRRRRRAPLHCFLLQGRDTPAIQSAGERQRGKTQQPKRPPHVVVSKQDRRKRGAL